MPSACRIGRPGAYNRRVTTRSTFAALGTLCSAVLLAACGGGHDKSGPATLSVTRKLFGRGLYIEGSASYFRVEQGDQTVVEVRLSEEKTPRAPIRLIPGSYRLVSFQRPCDPSCAQLDPPTDRCSQPLEVKAGSELGTLVLLRPGEGCSIVVRD